MLVPSVGAPCVERLGIAQSNDGVPKTSTSDAVSGAGAGQSAHGEVKMMCETFHNSLNVSTESQCGCSPEEKVMSLLRNGQLPIYQVVSRVEACEQEVVSAISRLIARGVVGLVLLQYPWGIEFELQANQPPTVA